MCPEVVSDVGLLDLPERGGSYHEFQTKRKRKEEGQMQQDAKRAQRRKVRASRCCCIAAVYSGVGARLELSLMTQDGILRISEVFTSRQRKCGSALEIIHVSAAFEEDLLS